MKNHLKVVPIPHGTDEWYAFREKEGIGGSEAATALSLNKYSSAVRLYHEKIGNSDPYREANESMFWGQYQEEAIANIWRYYDGSDYGYIENYRNGKIVRNCRAVKGYIVNPKYPWLFMSVDRLINIKGGFNLITGEALKEEGVLECKNMNYWMSQIWGEGIPLYHLIQVHVYMAILETDYTEIAILVDGSKLQVEKIMQDEILTEKILKITKSFWYDRVVPAREARINRDKAMAIGDLNNVEKYEAIIQRLEPEPDDSDDYTAFMEEKFVKERPTVEGTMELFAMAKQDKVLTKLKGRIDTERTLLKNHFINFLTKNSSESVDFGKLGTVNWSERKGSASRTFNNRIKDIPPPEYVEREFIKLDLKGY